MRSSGWTDLPAFDVGDVYDGTGTWIDFVPPNNGYGTPFTAAGFGISHATAEASVSYFGTGTIPGDIATLRQMVDAGVSGGWNYYPGLEDEWTGADKSLPSPPRDNGPFAYGSSPGSEGGTSRLGQRSGNEAHWLLLDYNVVVYSKATAYGILSLPSNHDLANYFDHEVGGYLPAGSGDDSWSWVETNGHVDPVPILPSSIDVGMNILADSDRASGVIEIYACWLPNDGVDTISDLWIEDVPRAGWTNVGSISYTQAAGWSDTTIDISGMATDGNYPNDIYHTQYRLAITLRNVPNNWTDPGLGATANGPYVNDVTWSGTRISAHYNTGAMKYRFVGPEVIEGGPSVSSSHIGIVMADSDVSLKLVTNGTITDSAPWPYPLSEYAAGALAVARPGSRVGNSATFLTRAADASFHLVRCTAMANGTLSIANSSLSSGQVYINGVAPSMFGGNETSRILLGINYVGGYRYAVLDTATGVHTPVTGIYPSSGTNEAANIATFSQGGTFLLMNYTYLDYGPYDLTIQRYTISSDGTATAVGPKMSLPDASNPARIFDGYYSIGPGDVWDDGEYVAVGLVQHRDPPYDDALLKLAIFNYTSPNPIHLLTLHQDTTNTLFVSATSTVTFAKSENGYTVSYARMSKRPVAGSTESEEWQTYVTRDINPVTGELGDEVFGSDSDYGGTGAPLVRADGGSTLAFIERYPMEDAYPTKIAILNAIPGGSTEGVKTLVPWRGFFSGPSGYTNAYAWVGVNGYGGYGRLYFKYRRP